MSDPFNEADPPVDVRAERIAYAVAIVGLITLGVFFRTPILNWIVGPAFVVTVVVTLTPILTRYFAKRPRA